MSRVSGFLYSIPPSAQSTAAQLFNMESNSLLHRAWKVPIEKLDMQLQMIIRPEKALVLEAVQRNGWALGNATEELQNDKDIVMAAVLRNPLALGLASKERRSDRDIVLAAVRMDGLALMHASECLKADKEIALVAVSENRSAINLVAKTLQIDADVQQAAKGTGLTLPKRRKYIEIALATQQQQKAKQKSPRSGSSKSSSGEFSSVKQSTEVSEVSPLTIQTQNQNSKLDGVPAIAGQTTNREPTPKAKSLKWSDAEARLLCTAVVQNGEGNWNGVVASLKVQAGTEKSGLWLCALRCCAVCCSVVWCCVV